MLKIQKKNVLKIYNLPKDVKFCKNCVASNQRPRVSFNKDNLWTKKDNKWKLRKQVN